MKRALSIVSLIVAACGSSASVEPAQRSLDEVAMTPHDEMTTVGPLGTGLARCAVMLYAWDGTSCRFQLNHCQATSEHDETVSCLSLADERTVACGATADACGQTVRCVCPEGPAPTVVDAPGTWHVRPDEVGAHVESASCRATVTTIAGGPPPAPCIFDVHETDSAGGAPIDRQEMLSCGVRSELCGRPVRCDCP